MREVEEFSMQVKQSTFTFSDLRVLLTSNFKKMSAGKLFYVSIDREEVWDKYLEGFKDPDFKQEHNCNRCKSFLRQYAGIVSIEDGKVTSIWDNLEVPEEFKGALTNLRDYIHSRPVTDVFLTEQKKCGTEKSLDKNREVVWNHFYLEVPNTFVASDIATKLGPPRDDKNVLKRSLEELTIEASETILELIAQNSLYRGKEFEALIQKFLLLQRQYKKVQEQELAALEAGQYVYLKDNFCWAASSEYGSAISRIRNTAIGTLLIDLSEGMDLDQAVTRFEKVVAPTNYKRPTSLVTPKMVEQAKETLSSLGLLESLERRYANEADLRVCDILFTDRASVLTDVFDEVAKETLVNPKSFSKVEEIGIQDFLDNVLPTAKSISVLLENSHMNNFVSIITAQDSEAPTLFKWDNNFSWSYTGAIADSIKERVKAAGGNVVGELRTSLSWYNYDDLDIHVQEPNKNEIMFNNKISATSGKLDVDMNAGGGTSRTPVENIIWTDKNKMKEGTYKVAVNNFCQRENKDSGYTVQIECAGEVFDFEFKVNPKNRETHIVAEFDYSKEKGITFKDQPKSSILAKEKWGLKTCRFHKVTKALLSPNHWGGKVGNRHYFFMLEDCISDEAPRPFFNEFLKQDFEAHRKVFEILGSKVKVDETNNQLSGLGFSDTMRASMLVKVKSKFERVLKVNF